MTSKPSQDAHGDLYSAIAAWYVKTFYDDLSDIDWLRAFAAAVPPKTLIADIGCGPGQFARIFRELGFPVVSMDLSEGMLEQGIALDSALVPVVSDIRRIPLRASTVGGLLAAYTLEHVRHEEIKNLLEEFGRVIVPGGALALMVKCGQGEYEFKTPHAPRKHGFVQLWTLEELSGFLADAGFATVATDSKPPVSPHEFNHARGFILARHTTSPRANTGE